MPALPVNRTPPNNQWDAVIASTNPGVAGNFANATIQNLATGLKAYAQAVIDAQEAEYDLAGDVGGYLELSAGVPSAVFTQVLATNNGIISATEVPVPGVMRAGRPTYTCAGCDVLEPVLVEAGTARLHVLP